ncbi:MAG TPA: hypothetical protein VEW27_19605 [Methylomirabilota bacterium]|nr:hypothetical protein [Methylomirabilota bacterium]
MMTRAKGWVLAGVATMLMAGPAVAQESVTVLKDLTAVIALQGLPCGQVVRATKQAENDYVASCQDGNRYRVFTNAQGRVVVQKQ